MGDSDSSSVVDGSGDMGGVGGGGAVGGAPKRQSYLIGPRIGRSGASGGPSAIWSALEEAALTVPGQVQPHRGFPGPLRSSLLFLVGNRRSIGPRSAGGLLPQARIGRRSAPVGLMPQPRVGRRSAEQASIVDTDFDGGDSPSSGAGELTVASLAGDSSLNEALESILG